MAEFNYREFLKSNPLLKEEVKDSLITESKQPKVLLKENKYFTTDEDGDEILDLDLAAEYLSQTHDKEEVDAFFSDDEVFEDLPYDSEDFPTEEAVEGALENAFEAHSGEGDVFEGEAKPSSKVKKSELQSQIKEMILASLTEADEEEDVEAKVEDEMDVEAPIAEPEVAPEEGLTSDEQEIQDSLKIAYDNAVQIGDDKLADQIGNTITFFTRSHVVNK